MNIRRPSPLLRTLWAAFLVVLVVGFALLIGHVSLAPAVVTIGAIGFVATGIVIFATTPRTRR